MHMMTSKNKRQQGFSMVEVLVTVVILTVGLLGLVKMQASIVSNTQIARVRSLVALQANSMAAAMHTNSYWSSGGAPATISASGTTITEASGELSQDRDCYAAACTPTQLAAATLQTWVANLNASFPSYTAQITCVNAGTTPPACVINIGWTEKYVAVNRSTIASAGATQTATQQYRLHVIP